MDCVHLGVLIPHQIDKVKPLRVLKPSRRSLICVDHAYETVTGTVLIAAFTLAAISGGTDSN